MPVIDKATRIRNDVRAIDLYSGIGGWSLGLKLAGIEVVASYEWWQPAIDTHNLNHGGELQPINIRTMRLDTLPADIDFVVGSPPCTEFSYANRGGSGDLAEGLKDLVRFFEVVDCLKPRFWAMENVPRVEQVLRHGFTTKDHPLYKYRHLKPQMAVFDMAEFGTPQARRRCIATNIPLSRIRAFKGVIPTITLGDVVSSFAEPDTVTDPIWGVSLARNDLTDTEQESPLNAEEYRMNREAKEHHPVYNNMAFPDPLSKPARTVTATCTRVSRESIVIADPRSADKFRRLTIRERASLQGFPITYQFQARSFAEKAKMIGNAIPPTFTHVIGLAAQSLTAADFAGFDTAGKELGLPSQKGTVTPPDSEGRSYPEKRAFRSALPRFRFKSGMRFELANSWSANAAHWSVGFYFGPSKDIRRIDLDGSVTADLTRNDGFAELLDAFQRTLQQTHAWLERTSPEQLQCVWTHRAEGIGPFDLTDRLAALADELYEIISAELDEDGTTRLATFIVDIANSGSPKLVSRAKLERNAVRIIAGILIGDWFNGLPWHERKKAAA